MLSKTVLVEKIAATLNNQSAIRAMLEGQISLPDSLHKWLSRLKLLYGVPYNYLVPDERMLPPESIRFFKIDMNWVDALIDGAYSIGRDLSANPSGQQNLAQQQDSVTQELVRAQVDGSAGAIRAEGLGQPPVPLDFSQVVSGLLLRSEVVQHYPGLGVNAYLDGQAPDQTKTPTLMHILRFERLGPASDTLICLLLGDVYRVDIHEAPEQLHYGFDDYKVDSSGTITATKGVKLFDKTPKPDYVVTFCGQEKSVDCGDLFRKQAPRTVRIEDLVAEMQTTLGRTTFNSAEFGFEMTEGVGMVQFLQTADKA
jgi:hypothetical protein